MELDISSAVERGFFLGASFCLFIYGSIALIDFIDYLKLKIFCFARHNGTLNKSCSVRCPYHKSCVFYTPPVSIWACIKGFFKKKKRS